MTTTGCLAASTLGHIITIDARCTPGCGPNELIVFSGDSIGVRIELSESELLLGVPISASWQVFDHDTEDAVSSAHAIEPSMDMVFVVSDLLHSGSAKRRRLDVQTLIEFDDTTQKTVLFEVWVQRRHEHGASPEGDDLMPIFVGIPGLTIGGATL